MVQAAVFPELALFVWFSPAFPVGSFAYSHAVETAVETGLVSDAASLRAWLRDLVEHGSIRQDSILLVAAWRAAAAGDRHALDEVNALALALCAGRERRLETATTGGAFLTTLANSWPDAVLPDWRPEEVAYPVAVGVASALQGLDCARTTQAFALAFVANLVSAALRLGAVGQTAGQQVTAALLDQVARLAAGAPLWSLDDLGSAAFRSDLAALQHETQYSRLFRS